MSHELDTNPSQVLRRDLSQLTGYEAAGMVPVPAPLDGLGVFPGGHGLWDAVPGRPLPELRRPAVMVLANDFFTHAGFLELQTRPLGENKSETFWRQLQLLLHDAEVPLNSCFFTNAIMGLRARGASTGKSPGFRNQSFRGQCEKFLARQIEVVRPAVILTLGEFAPQVLATIAPALSALRKWPGFAVIDQSEACLFHSVSITGTEARVGSVAVLVHPSYRQVSVKRRRFGALQGHAAEVELVKAAMRGCGR